MSARMQPHEGRVILLRTDDRFLHLYETVDAMTGQGDVATEDVGFDLFDTEGHRLTPGFSSDWTVKRLYRSPGEPRPASVCRRLRAWVRHMRAGTKAISDADLLTLLRKHLPVVADDAVDVVRRSVRDLPDLADKSLPDCFELLLEHVTVAPGTIGGPDHMWQHLNGTAHQ